jgi:hypothetical protein
MDPIDMNGISCLSLPIQATAAQKKKLKQLLKNGGIVSGKSSLVHRGNDVFDDSGIFLPPDLDIAASISNGKRFGRRLVVVTGDKPILVVKVYDSNGLARSESTSVIGDDVFATLGDPLNLKSQMWDCSFALFTVACLVRAMIADGQPTHTLTAGTVCSKVAITNTCEFRCTVSGSFMLPYNLVISLF